MPRPRSPLELPYCFVQGRLVRIVSATRSAQAFFTVVSVKVDPSLPPYAKGVAGVSGNVKSIGSDTMNNLMTLWAEDFRKQYPNVQVEIEGKGSSTAWCPSRAPRS